ncbi:MAG: DEAD/DEAH box helicase [Rudanella sp.]|nr:DEAD/DEAH box helicase [Rudanella sp.]
MYSLDEPQDVWGDCECSYDDEGVCKHAVASSYALEEYLRNRLYGTDKVLDVEADILAYVRKKNLMQQADWSGTQPSPPKPVVTTQAPPLKPAIPTASNTTVRLKNVADETVRSLVDPGHWSNRRHYQAVTSVEQGQGYETFSLFIKKTGTFKVRISRVQKGEYHFSCSCNQKLNRPLCEHQMGTLLWLSSHRGILALELLRDLTDEKNALLAEFGYSVADKLTDLFDFKLNPSTDKLELLQLDRSIQRVDGQGWETLLRSTLPNLPNRPLLPVVTGKNELPVQVYLFEGFARKAPPYFQVALLKATPNAKTGKLTNVERPNSYDRIRPTVDATDLTIMNLSQMLNQSYLNEYLKEQGFRLGSYAWSVTYTDEMREVLLHWSLHLLDQLIPLLADRPVRVLKGAGSGTGSVCTVEQRPMSLHFQLQRTNGETVLQAFARLGNDEPILFDRLTDLDSDALMLIDNDRLARFATVDTALTARQFLDRNGAIRFRSVRDEAFFNGFLMPLANRFSVDFGEGSDATQTELEFSEGRVYLREDEQHLMLVSTFAYTDPAQTDPSADLLEMANDGRPARIVAHGGHVELQRRDAEAEEAFVAYVRQQHPDFANQTGPFFYLPAEKVLADGWLYGFYEALRLNQTRLFGVGALKKFRQNPYPVEFKIRQSSGIDWFDLQVEIRFGDQSVALADVRKAILRKQNYVELGDGSLGLLPEQWVQQHAQLFRLGQVDAKKDTIRLSKRHFTILENYRDLISDPKLLKELDDKKDKLLNFQQIKQVKLPANVQATLRPYQEEGYRWLNFLDEFGWGGCLADDMGLGKTLQMLTFLQDQKNKRPNGQHLVVMPKTLVFNWQAEAARFCPDLRLHVHTGTGRAKNPDDFKGADIVLTTYGAVRYDIDWLRAVPFEYVVLDESQAIKNPGSQIAKAVKLLKARNRLAMTGTPVENNTFDLYSQFDFLNPGFLGSEELFKSEYANPIDRQQDKTRAAELRRLIYPFLLKRTKEEGAKDLPDKTETVLYCEMGKQQRRVYEAFRDRYRDLIEGKIAEEGAEKSAFLILEGLLKLRQICDSPALIKTDEDYGHESAKLDELLREIEENASNHKIVIFSQFLGMLDLVRQRLERDRVAYEYLDGQTQDRAGRVQHFQSNENCRVFLMSLKAGGVGLNLTEADYVYLIDPWWNPAVEQQAIDRVHRIGQTKRVFAYRMICKDTVEEKILTLQDRKRALASELISTETGFLKKLSPTDILGLFS